jgi:O-acetyl-ADP-ribose deacetylase (regulator of RNase III)
LLLGLPQQDTLLAFTGKNVLTYEKIDITSVSEGIVVHGCNCRGVMGSGVAKAIKQKWPAAFMSYRQKCAQHRPEQLLGEIAVAVIEAEPLLIVGNLFTQLNYGRDGKRYADLEAIDSALTKMLTTAERLEKRLPFYSVKIGCGLGGLDWDTEVEPIYERLSNEFNVSLTICSV